MKILLIQIEKTADSYIEEGVAVYTNRLKNYVGYESKTISLSKLIRTKPAEDQKKAEATEILKELKVEDHVILLDERGKEFSSEQFATFIQELQNRSIKRVVFIIGGPYGFSQELYARANFKLSLSQMTFSHQMVRLFFVEQVYRAYTILKGEKYHHR